jgi:copper oxidase (laccase) domain-containing protein
MRALGAGPIGAEVGPHIRARCYEFGAQDLDRVAAAVGPEVRGRTAWGTPALDLTAGIRRALAAAGIERVRDAGVCTGCSPSHFSHRARGETARQAAVAWLEPG